ncbi:MAG: hypothetical protein AABZ60_01650 [Planctomycetota bacterium]
MWLLKLTCFGMILIVVNGCLFIKDHPLRETDFPQKTPLATFEKLKASVQLDEIDWAWNTLSSETRKRVSYTEFSAGWQLYRNEFYRILKAKLISSEPWSDGKLKGEKITVKNEQETQSFLLVEEREYWYLDFPSPWENVLPFKKKSE